MTDQERKETCADPDELFPTVDELFEESRWKRVVPQGTRGLNAEEKKASAKYDLWRSTYAEVLEALAEAQARNEALVEASRSQLAAADQLLEMANQEIEWLKARLLLTESKLENAVTGGVLMATSMIQLQRIMGGDELVPGSTDEQSEGQLPSWDNQSAVVRVSIGKWNPLNTSTLTVASHRLVKPLEVRLDDRGIAAQDVLRIAGYLEIEDGPWLTERAREEFQMEPEPQPDQSLREFLADVAGFDIPEDPQDPFGFQAEEAAANNSNAQGGAATSSETSNHEPTTEPPADV